MARSCMLTAVHLQPDSNEAAAGNVIDGTDRLFVVTPPEALDELS